MSTLHDPLWSPGPEGADPDIRRLERLLARYRHGPRTDPVWTASPTNDRRWGAQALAAVAVLAIAITIGGWFGWRLQWKESAAWAVVGTGGWLEVGAQLVTGADQRARLEVARIGTLSVSPSTRVSLLETREGRHRVVLESGHVHARIWAPPGWFGVVLEGAEVLDLGCEFELSTAPDGRGRAVVQSGWIMHTRAGQETLVPAGHVLQFDAARAGIPLRQHADAAFAGLVQELDRALAAGHGDARLESAVAEHAGDADQFALLSLLTRYPGRAAGPLYPRLAELLGAPGDARHRQAWASGSAHAINAWWERIPRPPKQWWRHWQDAFAWPMQSRAEPGQLRGAGPG